MLSSTFQRFIPAFILVLCAMLSFAQDTKPADINTTPEPQWYMQPWAWTIGVAAFILLMIAFFRRRRS